MTGSEDELLDNADRQLLSGIAELWDTVDPVPADLALEIRFRLSVRALHADVAELQREADQIGAFRDDTPVRTDTLTFSCDELSTMVTVIAVGEERVRLDGWVTVPECAIELRVLTKDRQGSAAVHHLRADADGRWTVDGIAAGPAQLVFRHGDRTVVTPYFDL